MKKKKYLYTIYRQDGSIEKLDPCPKKTFKELYEILDCSTIELIPKVYFETKGWGRCVCYGDEEARFNDENHRNPHFNVLMENGRAWDVVGDIVKEEVYHEDSHSLV